MRSLILSLVLIFSLSREIFARETEPSAYEILGSYDFPIGILPKGVVGYEFDEYTGRFAVFWRGSCSFTVESYHLKYDSTIRGTISSGRLSDLEGVKVKLMFFWTDIKEVMKNGDELNFYVAKQAAATFPTEIFEVCPQCGCGLNCGAKLSLES
ncbi:hypothetical protein M5689_008677 [Euphorbia peplus]|nr:hypothetical protein M5689_008677 [Euphorbia peplus]